MAAFYPSPAGATESVLPLDTWDEVVAANPELATLQPDVEAFLVRGRARTAAGAECYLVPIDACYELVGQLRRCGGASTAAARPTSHSTASSTGSDAASGA